MKIFLTGGSGYVGGTVAQVLLRAGHEVRGLVRNRERADAIASTGVEPVLGDLANLELVAREAQRADAVANCADSDARSAVEALLGALVGSGRTFVHTSGVTVVSDCACGSLRERVHDERSDFRLWSPRKDRVDVDNLVLCSSRAGVATTVLCLPLLYGAGLGLTRRGGIEKTLRDEADKGSIAYVGEGTNRWSTAHVVDVARLFAKVLESSPAGEFFFVENGEIALGELASALGASRGVTATTLDIDAAVERWGVGRAKISFGSNCRVNATLARTRFGWVPAEPGILASIAQEERAE